MSMNSHSDLLPASSPLWPALALLTLLTVACGGQATGDATASPEAPTSWAVLVDVSRSISQKDDLDRWTKQFDERLRELQPGDSLSMLAVGERSREAAPLVDEKLAPAGRHRGRTATIRSRAELEQLRQKARAGFQHALANRTSLSTDILGALARSPAGGKILIFSDMIQCDRTLDLERHPPRPQEVLALVDQLVAQGVIKPGTLRGARVWVYLDAVPVDQRGRAIVDRTRLRAFWSLVVSRLGGSIQHFDNSRGPAGA